MYSYSDVLFTSTDYEDDLSPRSDSTRIVTQDFPLYFAIVSRVRLDVAVIGSDGGVISSKVVPQVQAVFPSAALSKSTKVALQVWLSRDPCRCIRNCHVHSNLVINSIASVFNLWTVMCFLMFKMFLTIFFFFTPRAVHSKRSEEYTTSV